MCHFQPPLWDFFRPRAVFLITVIRGALQTWPYVFLITLDHGAWHLEFGLRSGVFSIPGIYVETYVYDDLYVRVLMTSYFFTYDHRVR